MCGISRIGVKCREKINYVCKDKGRKCYENYLTIRVRLFLIEINTFVIFSVDFSEFIDFEISNASKISVFLCRYIKILLKLHIPISILVSVIIIGSYCVKKFRFSN